MKRNHKHANKNQTEKTNQAQSVSTSESTVESNTESASETFSDTLEKQAAQQPSAPSESKKTLLGELRAVLENTKQETGTSVKGNEEAAEPETTAERVKKAIEAETAAEITKKAVESGTSAKDVRQAVAAVGRGTLPEKDSEPVAISLDALPEDKLIPEQREAEPLVSLTYESMAEAAETARKESTGRFNRDAVDDETFLAELYTLIGDGEKPKTEKPAAPVAAPSRTAAPTTTPRPAGRITPEKLQAAPEEYEDLLEDDEVGVPGWLKGAFLLLISLLLGAMTFYAVATDVIGKIF